MQATSPQFKAVIAGNDMVVDHRVTISLPLTRTNLLGAPISSLATGAIKGFTLAGGGFVSVGAFGPEGQGTTLVEWGTTSSLCHYGTTYPTKAGTQYVFSAWVKVPTGSVAVQLSALGIATGTASIVSGAFQQISIAFRATGQSTTIALIPAAPTTSGTNTVLGCDWLLESGTTVVGSYIEGTVYVAPYPDVTLAVESFQVDRDLTTDVPDGTRMITGEPTAQVTITLSGLIDETDEDRNAVWLFNNADPTSPVYRKDLTQSPVTVSAGIYTGDSAEPELVTIFVGHVDNVVLDTIAGTVQLTCLDPAGSLRSVPILPAFSDGGMGGFWDYIPGLTSVYAMDYILRANGLYTGPPPKDNAYLYASMHGSMWPEVVAAMDVNLASVQFVTDVQSETEFTEGFWVPQVPTLGSIAVLAPSTPITDSFGFAIEWWQQFRVGGSPIALDNITDADGNFHHFNGELYARPGQNSGDGYTWDIWEDKTTHELTLIFEAFQANPSNSNAAAIRFHLGINAGDDWHKIFMRQTYLPGSATDCAVQIFIDDAPLLGADFDVQAPSPAPWNVLNQLDVTWFTPVDTLNIWPTTTDITSPPFTPTAFLDASLNHLTAIPDVSGQTVSQVFQDIAEAEGGFAGFDEPGTFRFLNRKSLAAKTSSRVVTTKSSLKAIQRQASQSAVANHIQVPVNALQVNGPSVVWSATDVITIQPLATYSTVATTSDAVVGLYNDPFQIGVIPLGGAVFPGTTGPWTGYRAARKPDGTGGEVKNLIMTVKQLSPASLAINVTNPNGFPVTLVSPLGTGVYPTTSDGNPILCVSGQFVTTSGTVADGTAQPGGASLADVQWPLPADGGAAAAPGGEVLLTTSANAWRQRMADAITWATELLSALRRPRNQYNNTAIVADPSLQLGDRITLQDPDVDDLNDDAVIVGISTISSGTDWTQNLNLKAVSSPGDWLLGVPGRSQLGVSTRL